MDIGECRKIKVFHSDHRVDEHAYLADADQRLPLLQKWVGGLIERVDAHFHRLHDHEVWVNEEGMEKFEPNEFGCKAIGLSARYVPLSGPIVVVPREPEHLNPSGYDHCRHDSTDFYEALERGDSPAGWGAVIDARKFITDEEDDPEL